MKPGSYQIDALHAWLAAVLRVAGMSDGAAGLGARTLLDADAMGITTHGLARLPTYWSQLRRGKLRANADVTASECAGVLRVDAQRAFGPYAGARALEMAARRLSPERAFVPFLIGDTGHLGALATLVRPAAESGLVAFLMQSTQAVMAPEGAQGAAIGNNPIAFSAPRRNRCPLLIDFALSVTALSRVLDAHREQRPIPEGWAIDRDGQPTADTAAALAGALLPMAGHKGLALAMLVQVLAGALTGSRPDLSETSAAPGCGAFGFVANPSALNAGFDLDMDHWVDSYLAAAGAHARIPGERADAARRLAERNGVAIAPFLLAELRRVGAAAGVAFPY